MGIEAVGALEVWPFDFTGFQGLDLEPGAAPHMGFTAAGYAATGGSAHFHFPDGNASIARLLVRRLLPAAMPGQGAEDVVTARADYRELDRFGAPVRIRLGSTALAVRNVGGDRAPEVEVAYARGGTLHTARAGAAVLACWACMIPYLCPEMPKRQREALHSLVKTPLVYTTVALSDWRAFASLGVASVYAPGSYHHSLRLNAVVDIGDYKSARSPDEPILVRMTRVPCSPGLDPRSQFRAGRADLLAASSRRSSATLATSFSGSSLRNGLIRRPTSWESPSIAGRTATPTNTIRCSIRTGTIPTSPRSSAARRSAES